MASLDLVMRIVGQDKTGPALKSATDNVRGLGKASDVTAKATTALKGALAGLAVGAAAGAFFKKTITAASDLEQAMGSLEAVFGSNTAAMTANAKAASKIGLSQAQYAQSAAVLGAQLGNLGIRQEDLGATTDDLVGKAADMAAQFGGTTAEALEALGSLMRGERDPVERFGVTITEAGIQAEMAATGLDKTQATLSLLNKQLQQSGTIGAAAREMDTLAGSTGRMKAAMENAAAQIGGSQLPVMAKLADMAEGLAPQLADALTPAFGALGTVALDALTGIEQNLPEIRAGIADFGDRLKEIGPAVERNWPQIKETFENVAGALERVGQFTQMVWDAFKSLPPEVQQLLALLAVAQKTGALSVAFSVADFFKQFMNLNAGVVNVNGPVGGVGGTAGKAGAAGKAGGALAIATPVTLTLLAGAVMYAKTVDVQSERREQGKSNPFDTGTTKVGASTTPADQTGYWALKRKQMEEEKKYTGILSQQNTVITYSNALTNESREATARKNAAIAQSTPLTTSNARSVAALAAAAAESSKTTGLLTGAVRAAGTASGLTDAQVKAMTSAVLSVPADASLPQLKSAIEVAGRAAGLTDAQVQGVTASVLAVPREAALPGLRDAIARAGAAAGLTDAQTQAMTAAVLAIPPNASVPQLRDAIARAGQAAGLTDAQIQGVTAAALAVPRDTPANVSTNAPTATTQVQGLQATINSLTGKQVNIRLSFMNDAGFSDSRATYYGSGGNPRPANSEPDMESFVMKSIKNAIPEVFPGGGGTGAWRRPAANYSVSSEWMRGGRGIHYGIDLAGPMGTPIFAASRGVVSRLVRSNVGYGNMIQLDHGAGLSTLYAHLAGFAPGLGVGSSVLAGAVIGSMGSTGDSTGPHLHFETKIGGVAQEPRAFMAGKGVFFANGGYVTGPGGPRDDKIPAMLSNGEFVMNAEATRRNRAWLEALNSGMSPSARPEPVLTSEQWRSMNKQKTEPAQIAVQVILDGRVIDESLVRTKRENGGTLGLLK